MRVAIIGGGWAGLACAVESVAAGHKIHLFEASRHWGGRARTASSMLVNGAETSADNGQHILIGAYTETLRLLQQVGVDVQQVLHRYPLALRFPDQSGLALGGLPSPWDALLAIATAKGWTLGDKANLLMAATRWFLARFQCAGDATVAELCQGLSPTVRADLIDPLCVSALNTPAQTASAQVFLRVLNDSLFSQAGASNLLLPTTDLSNLFPHAAVRWLTRQGAQVQLAARVADVQLGQTEAGWCIDGQHFDQVVVATDPRNAAQVVTQLAQPLTPERKAQAFAWAEAASRLRFEAITTVYATVDSPKLVMPMTALRCTAQFPAQFVFDKGQLGGPPGLLAFVVSASHQSREDCEAAVVQQARVQLGLDIRPVQTLVEKRATFACTPGLRRPGAQIIPTLLACGDYIDGPYPATLEGAVRSGCAAAQGLARPATPAN